MKILSFGGYFLLPDDVDLEQGTTTLITNG